MREGHHLALDLPELESLAGEIALGPVEKLLELLVLPSDTSEGQTGALPDVVVVDFRHRRAEAPL